MGEGEVCTRTEVSHGGGRGSVIGQKCHMGGWGGVSTRTEVSHGGGGGGGGQ